MIVLVRIGIFCIGLLLLLQIWVSHTMITQGANLKKIDDLQSSLIEENLILSNQIASASAYLNIATRSGELGFTTPRTVQYIR